MSNQLIITITAEGGRITTEMDCTLTGTQSLFAAGTLADILLEGCGAPIEGFEKVVHAARASRVVRYEVKIPEKPKGGDGA